jgi:hypothetical protein
MEERIVISQGVDEQALALGFGMTARDDGGIDSRMRCRLMRATSNEFF